jgi:hypothetical protein
VLLFIPRVTRWFIKPGVSPGENAIRLRQHGTFFLFHKKIHVVNFFVKKIRFLPPGRRRQYLPGQEPRNAWNEHALRGAAYFGLVTDPDVSFACGSMVVLFSFHEHLAP